MIRDEILDNLAAQFYPKVILPPSDWSEKNIILAGPAEVLQGPLDLSLTPWVKYILNRAIDPKYRDVSLQFSTQTAKTLTLRLLAAYLIANYGGSMMFCFPNEKLGKSFSEKRWLPLINNCKELSKLKTDSKHDFNKLNQNLINAVVKFVGSHSPAQLSSESCRWLIVDEINKLAAATENSKEADAVSLIKERTKAFSNIGFKRLWASTPTDSDGEITKGLEDGSNTRMLVKSPFALDQPAFELTTKHLKCAAGCKGADGSYNWSMVLNSTYLECPHTKQKILDHHKAGMLANAEYVDTNLNPNPHHFSFQLSALYSPFVKWGECLVEFLKSRGSVEMMRNYTNNFEGLAFDPYTYSDFSKSLHELKVCGEYKRGEEVGTIPLMLIDRQMASFKWIIRKYMGKKSWLIDWGECLTYAELDQIHFRYKPLVTAIDSGQGDRTGEIYRAVDARKHLGWIAIKGHESFESGLVYQEQKINPHTGTAKQALGRKIILLGINNKVTKMETNFCRNGGNQDWKVPDDITSDYEKELFNEIPKKSNDKFGRVKTVWRKTGVNDFWDLECYAHAVSTWKDLGCMDTYTPLEMQEPFKEEIKTVEEVKIIEKPKEETAWTFPYGESLANVGWKF